MLECVIVMPINTNKLRIPFKMNLPILTMDILFAEIKNALFKLLISALGAVRDGALPEGKCITEGPGLICKFQQSHVAISQLSAYCRSC